MNAFRKMCVTICGRFGPDEGRRSAIYGNRIRAKYTAKWDAQIVRMIFQTRYKLQIFLPTVRIFRFFQYNFLLSLKVFDYCAFFF